MKVLVLGQGGREHAVVRALRQSSRISEVHVIPGNDGIAQDSICHPDLTWANPQQVVNFCVQMKIDFVFIGPEDPLVAGVADVLRQNGILCFGPNQKAAQLEGSKIFAKKFMLEAGVPTAKFEIVSSVEQALSAASRFTPPYVLKADGLAAGKGVFICKTLAELESSAADLFNKKILGKAGLQALLEQFQPGWELSYLVLTNGHRWSSLPIAQDHKRLLDDDQGPNTGGMGTIAPLEISADLQQKIEEQIVQRTIAHLEQRQDTYHGVIFIGLMITADGPQVLEYNVRFGDPETQVILPLFDGDWAEAFYSIANGQVPTMSWKQMAACCVVLAAPGYPNAPKKGEPIQGDLFAHGPSRYFLHAGIKKTASNTWVVDGGRAVCAIGLGFSHQDAIQNAYEQTQKISWSGMQLRKDIGRSWLTNSSEGPQS